MKKLFSFLILFVLLTFSNQKIQANTFIPDGISFENKTSDEIVAFKAGDKVNLNLNFVESDFPSGKTNIEYGVARRITNGIITEFEPTQVLGTQKSLDKLENKNIEVIIPNVFANFATSTYVFYVKSLIDNDPDRYNFNVSPAVFKIKSDINKNLIKTEFANFLHSDGTKHGLLTGPTIYDLSKFNYKGVASSTSLEIIFRSNFDTVLYPSISFTKLRSDQIVKGFKPEPISIKKGGNLIVIPLPNFDYEAGVYQGSISFDNEQLPSLDFQYIIGGDMVTFGQVNYATSSKDHIFNFDIYGTPVDLNLDLELNNISTSTIGNSIYRTEFIFKDIEGKELYKINKDIDFSTSTYSLSIPNTIKDIQTLYIKTTNKEGKVIYEGSKDLKVFENETKSNLSYVYILIVLIFLMLITIFIIKKRKNTFKVIALFMVLIGSLFVGKSNIKADILNNAISYFTPPPTITSTPISPNDWAVPRVEPYLTATDGTTYNNDILDNIKLRFQQDIRVKKFSNAEDFKVMFRATYGLCLNQSIDAFLGFSTVSSGYAASAAIQIGNNIGNNNAKYYNYIKSRSDHGSITMPYMEMNLGKLDQNKKNYLYVYHKKNIQDGGKKATDYYQIPLLSNSIPLSTFASDITPNTAKINWSYSSTTTASDWDTSQASSTWQTGYVIRISDTAIYNGLYSTFNFSTTSTGLSSDAVKSIRSINIPVPLVENKTYYVEVQGTKNFEGIPYKTSIEYFSFKTAQPAGCVCENRTQKCTVGTTTTSTPNSLSCAISASCIANTSSASTTFTFLISNILKGPTYTMNGITATGTYNSIAPTTTIPTTTSYSYSILKQNSSQSGSITVIDNFDGQSVTKTCTIDNTTTIPPGTNPPGTPVTGTTPDVRLTKSPFITLNKNGICTLSWEIENMPTGVICSLTDRGNISLSVNGSSTGSFQSGQLASNKRFTLTCSGGTLTVPVSDSTICRVNPNILEN